MNSKKNHRAIIPSVPEGSRRPLWSVMIPTYNCANYLRKTLSSVLAQAPNPDVMQIEVVDDNSSLDDPAAVVEELGYGRVGFYQQSEKVGQKRNIETCLKRSQGHLIHILHSDDYVGDSFYLKLQEAFEQVLEIGAAFCRHSCIDEHGHQQTISKLEQSKSGVLDNCLEHFALKKCIQQSSLVVRRGVYEQLGGFDSRLSCNEDWEMWVRIAAHYPVWYEIEPLITHRLHSDPSIESDVHTGENIRDARRAIEIFQSYLPSAIVGNLSNKARENCALYAINESAPQLLTEGDKTGAVTQVREALKCSHSFKVVISVLLFAWTASRFLWQKVRARKLSSLVPNPLRTIMEFYVLPLILRNNIKHIHGLREITYGVNELIVLCLVRNGELYVKSFIEHYSALGVKHIVFLDNDSTDDTVAIASKYENVTILQTKCPFKKYETVMRRYLVKRFSHKRWNLLSDIDELFDYPFSDIVSIELLLKYLNKKGYTAVIAQMLDMFSDKSLASLKSNKDDSIKNTYTYYDISNIQKFNYNHETVPNKSIKHHWAGIRQTLFGSNNYLTKVPLICPDKKMKTFVAHHHVKNACIADFTSVLLHYPFISSFYEKVIDAVETDRYKITASHEYEKYWKRLQQDPDLHIKQETARKLENVNSLLDSSFLVVSEDYVRWVKQHSKNTCDTVTINQTQAEAV